MNDILTRLAPALALCLPQLATAQSVRAEPADARASAPGLTYRSAFADYKPWRNLEPGDWRALNDKLAPVPGKPASDAGHLRAAPAASAATAPAAAPRHGQGMHGGTP